MSPEEVSLFLRCAVTEGHQNSVRLVFFRFTEKHECMTKTGSLVMQEVWLLMNNGLQQGLSTLILLFSPLNKSYPQIFFYFFKCL